MVGRFALCDSCSFVNKTASPKHNESRSRQQDRCDYYLLTSQPPSTAQSSPLAPSFSTTIRGVALPNPQTSELPDLYLGGSLMDLVLSVLPVCASGPLLSFPGFSL